MKHLITKMMAPLTACLCAFAALAQADETPFVPGELIIMLHDGVQPDVVERHFAFMDNQSTDLKALELIAPLSNIWVYTFGESTDAATLLEAIRRHKDVRAAQFNHFVKQRATTPNDPQFGQQWHHNKIKTPQAWDITTGGFTALGDEIVVAVIEDANYNHNDLIANHWVNTAEIPGNGIDDDGNGYVDDYHGWNPIQNNNNVCCGGHGTAVNGMVGARGNNGIGGAGVNWNVKIMNVRIGNLTESSVISSYSYAHVMRSLYNTTNGAQGAFVVATNASWGIDYANPNNYPVWCAYYNDLGAVGILNCGATANLNINIDTQGDMPTGCSSPYMVSVTATNSSDQRTFSAYGATTIDLAAPGGNVLLPSGSTGYSSTSGTSFASPCVAGAIALVYSAPCEALAATARSNPQLAADMVRSYILNGVDPVASLQGFTVTGGRLNVKNALDLALADCAQPEPCVATSITADASCVYDPNTGFFDAAITVGGIFSTAECSAESVCYRFANLPFTCIDLTQAGGEISNNSEFTITGLIPAMPYTIIVQTADGESIPIVVNTPNCTAFVAGCTDPLASNYNPLANFDNGTCEYQCNDVMLSISTDCNGAEVSWDIRNSANVIVASAVSGTYGNLQLASWTGCLPVGCYTFNIYDAGGNGMNGTASGCSANGDYFFTDLTTGQLLFTLTAPNANYGFGTSHSFCIAGSTNTCVQPYPVATGLTANVQQAGVTLQWNPVPGSIACRIQGGLANGNGPLLSAQVFGTEPTQYLVPASQFAPQTRNYRWRVRCRCADDVQANWSPYAFFTYPPSSGIAQQGPGEQEMPAFALYPNPTDGLVAITMSDDAPSNAILRVYNALGQVVYSLRNDGSWGAGTFQVDLSALQNGIYFAQISDGDAYGVARRFVIAK